MGDQDCITLKDIKGYKCNIGGIISIFSLYTVCSEVPVNARYIQSA